MSKVKSEPGTCGICEANNVKLHSGNVSAKGLGDTNYKYDALCAPCACIVESGDRKLHTNYNLPLLMSLFRMIAREEAENALKKILNAKKKQT